MSKYAEKYTYTPTITFPISLPLSVIITNLFQEGIWRIPYCGGRTNIASALRLARTSVFVSPFDRQDAPNYVILLTDGSANVEADQTLPEAMRLKIQGTRIILGAVGQNLDTTCMGAIASMPSDSNVLTVDSFSRLDQLQRGLLEATCDGME